MKITRVIAVAAAITLVSATPALADERDDEFEAARTDGPKSTYIVELNPGADRGAEVTKVKGKGARVSHEYSSALNGLAVELTAEQAAALGKDPDVKRIQLDGMAYASDTQNGATWGLDRADQRALPLSTTYSYSTTASNVTAYIIDTGILATHTEFGGRVKSGFDAVTAGGSATDCNGHGTHVAGTVGGSTYGMAKGVSLVPVRVLGCTGSGAWSGVVAGIDWVISDHVAGTPAVANLSLGGGVDPIVDDAITRLVADGVSVVVAAGNSNADACSSSPARVPAAVTVGATTNTDARASYSNYGACLDLFGPGSNITSAWYNGTSATSTISGTSMASPHVAGAAALYLATNTSATPAQVASALVSASTSGVVVGPGTGSPNRLLFVDSGVTPPPPPAPVQPTITGLSPATGPVGTVVTISGTNLSGVTGVKFGATAATVYSTGTGGSLTATVPAGATSGQVSVTTAGGTALSPGSFTVTVPATAPTAPLSPRTLSVTQTSGTVTWNAPSSLGTLVRYEVRRGTGAWVSAGTATTYTFTGLRRNTSYTWSVRAVNTVGAGASAPGSFRTAR